MQHLDFRKLWFAFLWPSLLVGLGLGPALAAPGPHSGASAPAHIAQAQAAVTYTNQADRGLPALTFGLRHLFLDLDNDGDPDILYQNGNTSGSGFRVQLNIAGTFGTAIAANDANGTFSSGPLNGITFTQFGTHALEATDIDNDGDQDILESQAGTTPRLLRNNGNSTFTAVTVSSLPAFTFAGRFALIDLNNDGAPDILYQNGNTSGSGFRVQLNNGDGTFAAAIAANDANGTFSSGPLSGITFTQLGTGTFIASDLDDDGDQDLLEYQASTTPRLLRNNGNSTFTAVTISSLPAISFTGRYFLLDVESDGDQDILYQTGNTSGSGIRLQLNNGDGTFAAAIAANDANGTFSSGPLSGMTFTQFGTLTVTPIDYDIDGDDDISDFQNAVAPRFLRQEGTRPIITTYSPANAATGVSPSTNIVLTFDRSVVKGNGNLYLVNTATNAIVETVAIGASNITGSGTTWTYDPTATLAANTKYALRSDEETFIDGDGRAFFGIFDNTTYSFTTGAAATTVTSIVPASTNPTNATSVQFTVTFAASVSGLTTSNFTPSNGGSVSGSSVTSVSGSGTTWTVTVNTGSGSGTLGLTLANSTGISPSVSNTPFTGTPLYTIDKTAPVPTITSSTAASGSTTSTSPFSYTATFSEAVSGFVAGDITVSNGTVTSGPTGSGTTYTFTVTPTTAGTVTNVTVAAATVQDAVGNNNTASNTYALTFTPPTITVAPATLPNGTVATAYSQTLTASGGTAPYTYAITAGALPAGLSLTSAGVLSGTPTAGGSFNFTVRATDASATPGPYSGTRNYTLTIGAPTITVAPAALPNGTQGTAYSQTITASGGTAPYNFAITSGALPAGLSLNLSNGTISGTPTVNGTFNFTVTATDASTASGPYSGSRNYSLTIAPPPSVTVVSVTRLTPSPTATAQVSYRVVFSGSVSGVTVSNFTTTNSGTTVSGSSISSTSGSGTTYTVVVNTGTGNGTLRLDVANSTGISPTVSNVPYTAGEVYTITKSFAAAPTLRIQAGGSAVGNGDVTAFVDVVQVLQSGTSTGVANALQNGSFESNNVDPSSFRKATDAVPVVASPWSFTGTSGVARNGSAFGSTAADGDAVALIQSAGDNNAGISQSLAVPTGSYQVSFQAMQRNYTSKDQRLNVFVNDVFVGSIQPNGNTPPTYDTFTSASFSVTAQTLVATVSTTSFSPTSTAPIPFSVSFTGGSTGTAQSVGTSFTASDVTVSGGTLTSGSFSGSGAGPYTFTVTPSGTGTVTVSLAANVAQDANNTGNSASNSVSVQYQLQTATPAITSPVAGSTINGTPTFTGTSAPNAIITLYLNSQNVGTTTANGSGIFSAQLGSTLPSGAYTLYVTAQVPGQAVSSNSPTINFTVDSDRPTPTVSTTSASPTSTAPIPFRVTFNESVTGFSSGSVSVSNGTVASFTGSGTTYNLTITPNGTGTVTVSVTASSGAVDGVGNPNVASNSVSVQYQAPTLTISPATLPGGTVAVAYSQTITASGGTAPYSYAITAGALPSGLTLTSGGVLSGTPTVGGSFTFTVTATDASATPGPFSGSRSYTLTIGAPTITVAPATLAAGTVAVAYSQTITASGGISPYNFAITAGALPAGLTLSSAGVLSGTPTAGGSFTFTVTATDASVAPGPYTGSRAYTLTIGAPTIAVSPATVPNGTVGVAYSQNVSASSGTAPYSYAITAGALPAGLTLASNGTLSGTPTAGGSFTFTVTATDASTGSGPYTGSRSYTLTIAAPTVAVAPTTLSNGTVAAAYSQTITASGGTAPYSYAITAGALPAGLTLTSAGVLSGTPTAGGSFTFTVTATDASTGSGPYSGSRGYTITIAAPTVAVAPATLSAGTVGTPYSQTITASGGTAPYSFAITAGALPSGLTLASNGVFSGTPTVSGSFTFTVTATDASTGSGPYTGSRSYTLTIAAPATIAWTGATSTDWFTASNWSPAVVPTASSDVTIPNGTVRSPLIAANAQTAVTRGLTLNSGATLNMTANTLDVQGNLTNNGNFTATGGTVSLGTVFQSNGPNILGSSGTRFWNLTVQANGLLLSTSASTSVQRVLTLNGALVTQSNPFTLVSDANGTGLVVNNGNNAIIGSVTVQRYISPDLNAGLGYRQFSAPIGTATVASLSTGSFTPVVNSAYNSSATPGFVTPFPTVYGYNQSRLATVANNLSAFDKGWFSPASLSDALTVGQGYTVNLAAGQSLSVTGPQNNAATQPISMSLTRNATSSVNAPDAGWQLVGNPFPSPLDYSQVAPADRANLDAAIYISESMSQYSGTYRSYVNGIGGDPILALGQGFFARVSTGQTSGTLNFRNSQRVTAYQNPTFHRTAAESRPLVQLTLQGGSLSDNAYVYFENGATTAFDAQYDALKLPNTTGLNLSTSLSATEQLSIDGQSVLGTTQRIVPLAVGVPTPGSYAFNATQLLNLDTVPVYLRDLLTGAVVDLRQQPSYQFTVSNASALVTGRFQLVFSPQQALATVPAALAAQVAVYPNPAKSTAAVAIELPAALARQAVTVEMLDALGRVVLTQGLAAGQATHSLSLANIATGVYSLRLTTTAGVLVKKLIVE